MVRTVGLLVPTQWMVNGNISSVWWTWKSGGFANSCRSMIVLYVWWGNERFLKPTRKLSVKSFYCKQCPITFMILMWLNMLSISCRFSVILIVWDDYMGVQWSQSSDLSSLHQSSCFYCHFNIEGMLQLSVNIWNKMVEFYSMPPFLVKCLGSKGYNIKSKSCFPYKYIIKLMLFLKANKLKSIYHTYSVMYNSECKNETKQLMNQMVYTLSLGTHWCI